MEEQFPHNNLLLILDFIPCGIVTLRAAGENYLPAFRQRTELYLFMPFFSFLSFFNMLTCLQRDNYSDADFRPSNCSFVMDEACEIIKRFSNSQCFCVTDLCREVDFSLMLLAF